MRDATEDIDSAGYALFAVIKTIFSNPNGLEMIMNYIQTNVSINKNIKSKKNRKRTRYSDRVRTRNLLDSSTMLTSFLDVHSKN